MDGTPIWRTRLWPALMAWMGLTVAAPFAVWPMAQTIPPALLAAELVALFGVAPLVLLGWSLVSLMRDPITGWLAPTVFLAFCGTLVPASGAMIALGRQLHFDAQRGAYETVVADAKAGRLGGADGSGWVTGRDGEIRYRFNAADPGYIEFVWVDASLWRNGVRYDDTPCRPAPGRRCVSRGERLDGAYSYFSDLTQAARSAL